MQVSLAADRTWEKYAEQREGEIEFSPLLRGTPGAPDNYELALVRFGAGQYSPRHRHNFEQFRYPFLGTVNYSPGQDVPNTQLGYFPEGAYYGPQRIQPEVEMLILQFGGPSGAGYMSFPETRRGSLELKEQGAFEKGVFRAVDEAGKPRNKDGYEAVWEHVNGRSATYVTPRYREPVVIDPEAFRWLPVDAEDESAQVRRFGVFNEFGTAAAEYRVGEGHELTLTGAGRRRVFVVVAGEVGVDENLCTVRDAFGLEPTETLSVRGVAESSVLLNFDLPAF